jgi:hypothetical protein
MEIVHYCFVVPINECLYQAILFTPWRTSTLLQHHGARCHKFENLLEPAPGIVVYDGAAMSRKSISVAV